MQTFTPSVLTALSSFNAINSGGAVAVINTPTTVLNVDFGLCILGQLIIATFFAQIDKGAAIGDTAVGIGQAGGTGVIDWGGFGANVQQKIPAQAASTQWQACLTAVGRVTTTGTYQALCYAFSLGVNANIVINGASMRALRFNR